MPKIPSILALPLAGLLLSAAVAPAPAQEFAIIRLADLREQILEFQKGMAPRVRKRDFGPHTSAFFAVDRHDRNKVSSQWMTGQATICPRTDKQGRPSDERGRLRYDLTGRDDDEDVCEVPSRGGKPIRLEFRWTTTVQRNSNRLIFSGQATVRVPNAAYGPQQYELTERAVIRIAGNRCFVEQYQWREAETEYEHTAVRDIVTRTAGPGSRCVIE